MRCSFCQKSQEEVGKLITSPTPDYASRAYICDECIAVCQYILEDDRVVPEPAPASPPDDLVSDLLSAVELWMKQESLGAEASQQIAAVRAIAQRLFTRP